MKFFWIGAVLSGILFAVVFSIRINLFDITATDQFSIAISPSKVVPEKDTWKNIFQNGRKIGVSHSTLSKTDTGYELQETLYLRINTMGMVHKRCCFGRLGGHRRDRGA